MLIKGQFEERLQWILATLNVNCNVKSMIWKENTVNNKALVWWFRNDFSTRLQKTETRSPGVFAVDVNLARGFFCLALLLSTSEISLMTLSPFITQFVFIADRVAQSRFFHFSSTLHPSSGVNEPFLQM